MDTIQDSQPVLTTSDICRSVFNFLAPEPLAIAATVCSAWQLPQQQTLVKTPLKISYFRAKKCLLTWAQEHGYRPQYLENPYINEYRETLRNPYINEYRPYRVGSREHIEKIRRQRMYIFVTITVVVIVATVIAYQSIITDKNKRAKPVS